MDRFLREFILLELPMYPPSFGLAFAGGKPLSVPAPSPEGSQSLDPRLSPLAELAKRLVSNEQKKE